MGEYDMDDLDVMLYKQKVSFKVIMKPSKCTLRQLKEIMSKCPQDISNDLSWSQPPSLLTGTTVQSSTFSATHDP